MPAAQKQSSDEKDREGPRDPCRDLRVDPSLGRPRPSAGEAVLVTGGFSFIGSHLVEELLELGYVVHVMDNMEIGSYMFLDPNRPRLRFFYGDIMNTTALQHALHGVSGVFHFALPGQNFSSLKDPAERDAEGTRRVIEVANEAKLVRKVVYAARSSYSGNAPPSEVGVAATDNFPNLHILPLRLLAVYGPRAPTSGFYALVAAKFMERMREGRPLLVEGAGEYLRDFIYIKDVTRALILGFQSDMHGAVVDIGTGTLHTVKELADLLSSNQQRVPPRQNLLPGSVADTCRGKRRLNFQAEHEFVQTVRGMVSGAKSGELRRDTVAEIWMHPPIQETLDDQLGKRQFRFLTMEEKNKRIKGALDADPDFLHNFFAALPKEYLPGFKFKRSLTETRT